MAPPHLLGVSGEGGGIFRGVLTPRPPSLEGKGELEGSWRGGKGEGEEGKGEGGHTRGCAPTGVKTRRRSGRVDSFLNLRALRIAGGDLLPPNKFLIYSYQPQYENPLGSSDLRAAYRAWFIKEQALSWWAKFLEKFGMPTVVGSFDPKPGYGVDQQRQLLATIQQVHNESAIVHPSDMAITLLEAQRAMDGGFDEAVAYLDRSIAKSILGETLTADSSSHGSTYGLGQVHMDVLSFYLQKLQRDLEETVMTEQLIQRLIALNYPPGTPCPTFRLGKIDDGKLQTATTLIAALVAGSVIAPDEPWIREYLGIPAAATPSEDA